MSPSRILLVGMMGAGKTTTGNVVARRMGWRYFDSDAEIIRSTGMTVPEIFARNGEAAFRAEESRVLAQAVTADVSMVVAVAGGALRNPDNRKLVRRAGMVVWLRASIATMAARVGTGAGRPLLGADPQAAMERLYPERRDTYQRVAHVIVDVDGVPPLAVADRVVAAWHEWRRLRVESDGVSL